MRRLTIAFALLASGLSGVLLAFAQARPAAVSPAQAALNKTADAVLALKSARFSLKREGTPAYLDEKNGITFTAAECIYAAPDRVSCNVKVTLKNGTILQLTRVWVPEGTFQSNPLTRQFVKIPADSNFNGAVLFARSGIPDVLRTSVQKPQITGREKALGRDTLHVKGEVSGAKMGPLIGAQLTPTAMYPIDLWVEDASGNPAQLHVAEPDGSGWMIELSALNEPADVPTPTVPPAPAARP